MMLMMARSCLAY
uniref:Uncharacterized protein n=1 Tax=Anopheles albimanus TaxID=7167 RepID=A0A182FYY6_ANOAL